MPAAAPSAVPAIADSSPLPAPARTDRWQPLRSGVLNLYRYDYEEFHYAEGRLLLRGNNGSGKSRILALQLPFLLDGEVSPARVEPDGDAAKRIEWNLLMGKYPERTGYTWIEFGRRDADGTAHTLTLGCGLRAVAGHTGLHSRWFFITTQRIGRDLFLQTAQRTPLGRDRLTEAIGDHGRVFKEAKDYRAAVNDTLFGLGPRYGALIELLLRLRRPQLTRKLDENELPNALSDALPTLSGTIIEEVAESFRSLQADKDTLRAFTEARAAVGVFLQDYATYVRIAVRRRAAQVRTTQSGYESAQRAAKDAAARLEAASAELASLSRLRAELDTQQAGAETAERTLAESPEMRTADEIRLASEAAAKEADALGVASGDEVRAASAEQLARSRQLQAEEAAAGFNENLAASLHATASAAAAADLAEPNRLHLGRAAETDAASLPSTAATAEKQLHRVLAQRERALGILRVQEKSAAQSLAQLHLADAELRRAQEHATAAREAEHSARETLDARAAALFASYSSWRAALRHLQPPHGETLADTFADWVETREGPGPLLRAADAASTATTALLAARQVTVARTAAELTAELAQIAAEIDRLENGDTPPPPPPSTRRAERTGRPGAPLWRVCDFHPALPLTERAGLEAALQASGLLDAWVLPDGRLLAADEDTYLVHAASDATGPARHLGQLLVPAIDTEDAAAGQLTPATLAGLLANLGGAPGQGPHWVAPDGRWQLGPLSGRWTKPEADYLGASTRAAARRRQIDTLRGRQLELTAHLDQAREAIEALVADQAAAAAEFTAAPSEEPLLRAGYELETAAQSVANSLYAAERAAQLASARRIEWENTQAALHRDAADLHLAAWLGRLDELVGLTQAYDKALAGLWPTLRHAATLEAQLAALREQTATAGAEAHTRRSRREQTAALAEAARQRFLTLQETHGASVAEILEKHRAARAEVVRLKNEIHANESQQRTQTAEQSRAEENKSTAEQKRADQEVFRRTAIAHLQGLAAQRLFAEADPAFRAIEAGEWSVAEAVDIARQIETRLADTPADDTAWQQRQDRIHSHIQELRDQLVTHGHQPETHQVEDIILVRCLFQGKPHTMTELHAAFSAELAERDRLLQAREREIIENHLLAEAAVELQKLIRAADAWRTDANAELASRPTSTGVRFRFQWESDTESRFHEVRPILLRKGELWTPSERTALAGFLQGRIAAEQTADESGSWRDHLARALDYRRWHRFVIERQQEGHWRRLDKTTYGTGSGGEKALALTLPRFAAAAAHYRGAAPTAPRLVMLDEAFAGIDPTMRAQCLGVLTQFDLDIVMTSELEWGCYATVPALAIYHLTTLPGLDAVAATRWLWNGREKKQRDLPLSPAAPPISLASSDGAQVAAATSNADDDGTAHGPTGAPADNEEAPPELPLG
ncbi:MAG: TIGR02680 family protein [Opitutus sp.]|nr:TIGR02680 family protein [Opitutus sp.]MCS6247183.1 TIGR02680 family protein [Opitutus sp.]MCS6274074.1 TIGR02680 family protein [Opitutus sp.]MCS6276350.1 TIGR02680 family protein [Opitutus sp.]MCS6302002.1 TIGR02680 family protein [Opitutus sp.]